jgi:hypothetical protein
MAVLFPLQADRAGVVVIMPVTPSGVTNMMNVRRTSTSWTSALTRFDSPRIVARGSPYIAKGIAKGIQILGLPMFVLAPF